MRYTFMDRIGVLFDPRFWFRSAPVSRIYGRELETSMDLDDVSLNPWHGAETCRVGDDDVMIGDWSNYGQHVWFGVMPPRRTALRLHAIVSDRQKQEMALAGMFERGILTEENSIQGDVPRVIRAQDSASLALLRPLTNGGE